MRSRGGTAGSESSLGQASQRSIPSIATCLDWQHSPRRQAPTFEIDAKATHFKGTKKLKVPHPWEPGGTGELSKDEPCCQLTFDNIWRSRHVSISKDRASASWKNSLYGGFVMSEQPLRKKPHGRWFEVVIDELDPRWSDGFGIGVGIHPSHGSLLEPDLGGFYEGTAVECIPQSWMIGYDGRCKLGPDGFRYLAGKDFPQDEWKPSNLRCGDRVGLLATHDGHLMLFVNDAPVCVVTWLGIPWSEDLHAIIDLDGYTKALHFSDENGVLPNQVTDFIRVLREIDFESKVVVEDLRAAAVAAAEAAKQKHTKTGSAGALAISGEEELARSRAAKHLEKAEHHG